ncbi:hypothetical protein HID58_074753, partial [Brassica napus]
AMSQLFHLGERMDDHTSLRADLAALTSQLRGWDAGCVVEYLSEGAVGASGGGDYGGERAIVVTRWELMREWPNHQTDSWDLEGVLELYKMVDPMIPGKTEAEKTLEPTADDPPAD